MTIKKINGKSIRLSPDGFSFLTESEGKKQHVYVAVDPRQPFQKQFEQAVYDHIISESEDHSIQVILHDKNFLLIPENSVSQETEALLKEIANKSQAEEFVVLKQKLANNSIINHFGVDEQVYNFLKRTFPVVKFHHHITLWSDYVQKKKEESEIIVLHLLPYTRTMDLLVITKQGLQMANTYSTENNEEILYNTLRVIPELGIDQSMVTIRLYGSQQKIEQIKPTLEKYIANIEINTDENIEITLPNLCE